MASFSSSPPSFSAFSPDQLILRPGQEPTLEAVHAVSCPGRSCCSAGPAAWAPPPSAGTARGCRSSPHALHPRVARPLSLTMLISSPPIPNSHHAAGSSSSRQCTHPASRLPLSKPLSQRLTVPPPPASCRLAAQHSAQCRSRRPAVCSKAPAPAQREQHSHLAPIGAAPSCALGHTSSSSRTVFMSELAVIRVFVALGNSLPFQLTSVDCLQQIKLQWISAVPQTPV